MNFDQTDFKQQIQTNRIVHSCWFNRPATAVAPDLLGCVLVRQFADGTIHRGIIVETEAYEPNDPACHAYRRQTKRNQVMFGEAGFVYIYLIYGMYHCLNVVTDEQGVGSVVLIRALELENIPPWIEVKNRKKLNKIAAGPGKICQVWQIDRSLNGIKLALGQPLWIEHRSQEYQDKIDAQIINITQTQRIGISQGIELPWRWYITESLAVSVSKK